MKAIAPSRSCSSSPVKGGSTHCWRVATALSAVLLSMSGTVAAQVAPSGSARNVEITEKARQLFRAGVALVQDPDGARYEEAYQQFKAAYAEAPSWKILGNLGYTAMKLERDGEAIDAFRAYLDQGGNELSKSERAQFQGDLDTLSASTATVTVLGLPPGTRVTDVRSPNKGSDIRNNYEMPEGGPLLLRVRPGAHQFSAQWGGQPPESRELEIGVSAAHEVTFGWVPPAPAPPEPAAPAPVVVPPPRPATAPVTTSDDGFWQSPVPAYISLGVGAVGVGLGVVFLVQRSSATSDADARYDACLESLACVASDQAEMERLDDEAATMGTLSVVSLGVGAAGLGLGAALLLMNDTDREVSPSAAGVTLQPYASAHELGLWGRF